MTVWLRENAHVFGDLFLFFRLTIGKYARFGSVEVLKVGLGKGKSMTGRVQAHLR
jgi:hypothetical protein